MMTLTFKVVETIAAAKATKTYIEQTKEVPTLNKVGVAYINRTEFLRLLSYTFLQLATKNQANISIQSLKQGIRIQ